MSIQLQVPPPPQTPAVPGPGEIAAQIAMADVLRSLQAESQEVGRQLQSLLNRRENMVGRLNGASVEQAAAIHAEIAALDGSIAQAQGHFLEITARVTDLQSSAAGQHTLVPPPPPMNPFHMIDPDAVTAVFVMFSIGIIFPLSVGLLRRMWRRPATPPAPARESDMIASPRLERLEQAVDAIAIEIERISEGQRFVTKVLSERPNQARSANAGEGHESALGDAKPFLAIGAGPIEPIRVGERQPVRRSVTPH